MRSGDFLECWLSAQDGLRLYYRDYPGPDGTAARPVLCLPGLTRNSKDFEALARHLSGRRRVVCPDYRGRGRSSYDPDHRNYEPPVYLRDLAHLLAAGGLHGVAIVGTSLGGLLAVGLAVSSPMAVAGVVLNDVGPELDPAYIGRLMAYLDERLSHPDWAAAVTHLKATFPELGLRGPEAWQRFAGGTYRRSADGALQADWDPFIARRLRERLDQPLDLWSLYRAVGRIPVLAIRGGNSPLLSAETFERMAAEKPDLARVTVPGLGHAPSLDEPEAREAIDEFLERLDGGASRPEASGLL